MTSTEAQVLLRRSTYAVWHAANPTLAMGELGVETDTAKFKIGDGVTAWNSLAYSTGATGPTNSLHYLFLYRYYI
jgi:hypothetical protein